MAASISDRITDTFNAANPNSARVTGTRVALATTLTCDNLAGWPTGSAVHFATYRLNTSSTKVAGTQIDWKGLVTSSTTIGSLTRQAGAADTGNTIGDVVEMMPTASWAHDLFAGFTAEHNQLNGVHALTANSTLTSSKYITAINDTNGNELFKVTPTASAVNEFTVTNAATGSGPILSSTGGDTNIDLNLTPKGTGAVKANGNRVWQYLNSALHTSGTVTSSGATPTLVTDLSVLCTIPSGAAAVKITVQLQNLYIQTGSGLANIYTYSGATSGALTTQVGGSNANAGTGGGFGVVIGSLITIIQNPTAGAVYYSAAISATASNAKTDSSSTAPALILVEVC